MQTANPSSSIRRITPVPSVVDDLAGGLSALSSEDTGGTAWRRNMLALYRYLRRDMRDAREQREKLYPETWERHVIRTVPFVWSLSRELATAYVRRPTRAYYAETDTTRTRIEDAAFLRRIERLNRESRIDRTIRHAHRQLVAMNNSTIWVWPNPDTGGVTYVIIPPHEQRVIPKHPFSLSERDVAVWRFRVAVPKPDVVGQYTWAVGQVTPTQAVWVSGDLEGKGIWVDDGSNPFGEIPVVMLRGTDPGPGEWWAPCPEDILDAQRAINHDITDVGHIARLQGYGQPVWKGGGPKDHQQPLGPETAVAVPPDGDFDFKSPDAAIDEYLNQNSKYMEWSVAMNSLNPASFMKSPGITALAKQVELNDRESFREEHLEILQQAEQRLYDLTRKAVNWIHYRPMLPDAVVEVQHHVASVPADPLHSSQALTGDLANGQTSRVKARAKLDGVSLEEARKRVEEDLAETAEQNKRFGITPASTAGSATMTTPPEDGKSTDVMPPEDGAETSTPPPMDAPDVPDGPPALNAGGEVQKAALNGAQVAELRGTIQAVADGLLPAASARAVILASYPVSPADVDAMLAPLEGFVSKKPSPPNMGAPSVHQEQADVGADA